MMPSAYQRSRRTASKLLSKDPAAIIDVHRDGIPDPDSTLTRYPTYQYQNEIGCEPSKPEHAGKL